MTPVEQIKSRLSVVDVVSSYVKLVRAGSNFKAPCPFHSERTPSFFVSPTRDSWHCFGCGIGGDQFQFVMQIEGMDFREALRMLADRAGVELRPENPKERDERTRLLGLLELAVQFYEAGLKRYPAVEAYLAKRGVASESIKQFRLGYAPPESVGWRAFADFAIKKGYTPEELEKTGLAIQKQSNHVSSFNFQDSGYYDRFRNRIMFPITDASSRVIGFGGRVFDELVKAQHNDDVALAKYINTPQTQLYDKSAVLYAFDKAKTAIRKENNCIVVEGYMDALMAHQAGTAHVVAASGTALSQRQLIMLRRLCDKIQLSFDMDMAGENATRRSIDLALEMGFDVKAMMLATGKDPADLVAMDPALWQKTAAEATDIISYFLTKALQRFDVRTLDGKRGISSSVLPLVARLPREVDKAHWVSHVASRLGVREESVWQDLKKENPRSPTNTYQTLSKPMPHSAVLKERTRARMLEERVLGLLFTYGTVEAPALSEELFQSEDAKTLYQARLKASDINAVLATVQDERLRTLANQLMFETEALVSPEQATAELASCAAELGRERVKEKLEQLTYDIRKAEEAGNEQQVGVLVDEFGVLSKELTKIS